MAPFTYHGILCLAAEEQGVKPELLSGTIQNRYFEGFSARTCTLHTH
jgi:hypothetical protein